MSGDDCASRKARTSLRARKASRTSAATGSVVTPLVIQTKTSHWLTFWRYASSALSSLAGVNSKSQGTKPDFVSRSKTALRVSRSSALITLLTKTEGGASAGTSLEFTIDTLRGDEPLTCPRRRRPNLWTARRVSEDPPGGAILWGPSEVIARSVGSGVCRKGPTTGRLVPLQNGRVRP